MSMLSHTPTQRRRELRQADQSFDHKSNHERPSFFTELFNVDAGIGSHMPLDTDSHWRWNDPVNLFPGLVLLLILLVGIIL
jgi:hypothetical protein